MHRAPYAGALALCLLLPASPRAAGQTSLSLSSGSGAPGGSVSLAVSLTPGATDQIAGLQWRFGFSASVFPALSVQAGPAAIAAGKSITCNPDLAFVSCVVTGLNGNAIPGGVVATVTLSISAAPDDLSPAVALTDTAGVSPDGAAIAVAGGSGVVQVSRAAVESLACDARTLVAGASALCTVRIGSQDGATATLSTSGGGMTVPQTVIIAAGNTVATFTAKAALSDAGRAVLITGALGQSARSTTIFTSGIRPVALSCSPVTLTGGQPWSCSAELNEAAPAPFALTLASSSAAVRLPAGVPVGASQRTIQIQGTSAAVSSPEFVNVTAGFGETVVSSRIVVVPAGAPVLNVPSRVVVTPGNTVRFTVSATQPLGAAVTLSAAGLPEGAAFDPSTGVFQWTPAEGQRGLHTIVVTATDAAGLASKAEVAVWVADQPAIGGIVNAASFQTGPACSPGALATIFGTGFTTGGIELAAAVPLPLEMQGIRVRVNADSVPLLYVSPTQINFQCPAGAAGEHLRVVVDTASGSSKPSEFDMQAATPGIFVVGAAAGNQGAILIANTNLLAAGATTGLPGRPARPGEYISIFATGLGDVMPYVPAGYAARSEDLALVVPSVQVRIGGIGAEVTYAGLAPGFAGLYQINARVPEGTAAGDGVTVVATVSTGGAVWSSNTVTMAVER